MKLLIIKKQAYGITLEHLLLSGTLNLKMGTPERNQGVLLSTTKSNESSKYFD